MFARNLEVENLVLHWRRSHREVHLCGDLGGELRGGAIFERYCFTLTLNRNDAFVQVDILGEYTFAHKLEVGAAIARRERSPMTCIIALNDLTQASSSVLINAFNHKIVEEICGST